MSRLIIKFDQTNQILFVFVHFIVSKTIEELRLEWKNTDPVLMAKGLRMPQFEIGNIVPSNCQESFQIGMMCTYIIIRI